MITSGIATVYVSDMDRAVKFYTDTLGLKLQFRSGDDWAQVEAGSGLTIGLHPSGDRSPRPGSHGSIQLGFSPAKPLDEAVAELTKRGVVFRGPIVNDDPVRLALFGDPDGNDLYLCEYKGGGEDWT